MRPCHSSTIEGKENSQVFPQWNQMLKLPKPSTASFSTYLKKKSYFLIMSPEKGVICLALRPEVSLPSSKWGFRTPEFLFIHQWKLIRFWIRKWEMCIWLSCNINHLPHHLVSNGNYLSFYWDIFPYYREGRWMTAEQGSDADRKKAPEVMIAYLYAQTQNSLFRWFEHSGSFFVLFFFSRMQTVWNFIDG